MSSHIFKKGDKKDVSNYRPISLTFLTTKVMKRILYEKILFHTENLIDSRQHSFSRNKSCSTNMISLTESLSVSLLNKVSTDIIYFNFAKAFDSVCHDLILINFNKTVWYRWQITEVFKKLFTKS